MAIEVDAVEAEMDMGHGEHMKAADSQKGLPGKFQRPIKITLLGAGSMFTPKVLNDILQIKGADKGEIALVDIDQNRLGMMHKVIEKVIEKHGKADGWTVVSSTDRREVMPGSDYLTCCVEVSGVDCVDWDNDIPQKYGVDQCIGDTIGPGGLFKALRTVPVFLDILRDAEELCPDAIMLNYTNPMSIMCLAAGRTSSIPVVGLCHSVQHTGHQLADYAGVPYGEMKWECAGINHLSWFTKLEHMGESLYPRLFESVKNYSGDVYEEDAVRFDMMMHFGAFITESSGHLSEYVPYYRKRAELMKRHCRAEYRGESRYYADNWPIWRKNHDKERAEMVRGERDCSWERTWEYCSWIIEGREKDVPTRIHGNVMNNDGSGRGQLITNLPADGCVEVACMVDMNGVHATRYGALPAQMAAVCESNMRMYDLAATACIEQSKEAAIHALLLDPLTSAVCSTEETKALVLEMFETEKDFLRAYK